MSIYSTGAHFYNFMDSVAPLTQSVLKDPALMKIGFGAGMVFLGSAGLYKSGVGRDVTGYFSGDQTKSEDSETAWSKASRYGLAAISALGIGVGVMAIGLGASEWSGAAAIDAPLNMCDSKPYVCNGHLDIPRKNMPQIEGAVKTSYVDWWESQGASVRCKVMNASHLMSTQNEINEGKVHSMLDSYKAKIWDPCVATILASSDGHVLDGHHRWATCLLADQLMSVTVIDAPIQKLLHSASVFKGVEHHGLGVFHSAS